MGFERAEWASGIADALGKPFAPPSGYESAALEDSATTHAKDLTGETLGAWYRSTARAYATATAADRLYWPLTPKGWRRWLDAGSPPAEKLAGQSARAGPKRSLQPVDPNPEWMKEP